MRGVIRTAVCLGLLAVAAGRARADVAFNDFGPGDSFNTNSGCTVSTNSSETHQQITSAMQFTSAASGSLTSIELAMSIISGANSFTVTLNTDSGGLPGAILESFTLTDVPTLGTSFPPEVLTSVVQPTLTAGTNYWINISPSDLNSDTWGAWNFNSIGVTGLIAQNGISFGVQTLSAFAVNVSAVPEPSSLALGLLGAAGALGLGARRVRRSVPA